MFFRTTFPSLLALCNIGFTIIVGAAPVPVRASIAIGSNSAQDLESQTIPYYAEGQLRLSAPSLLTSLPPSSPPPPPPPPPSSNDSLPLTFMMPVSFCSFCRAGFHRLITMLFVRNGSQPHIPSHSRTKIGMSSVSSINSSFSIFKAQFQPMLQALPYKASHSPRNILQWVTITLGSTVLLLSIPLSLARSHLP